MTQLEGRTLTLTHQWEMAGVFTHTCLQLFSVWFSHRSPLSFHHHSLHLSLWLHCLSSGFTCWAWLSCLKCIQFLVFNCCFSHHHWTSCHRLIVHQSQEFCHHMMSISMWVVGWSLIWSQVRQFSEDFTHHQDHCCHFHQGHCCHFHQGHCCHFRQGHCCHFRQGHCCHLHQLLLHYFALLLSWSCIHHPIQGFHHHNQEFEEFGGLHHLKCHVKIHLIHRICRIWYGDTYPGSQ